MYPVYNYGYVPKHECNRSPRFTPEEDNLIKMLVKYKKDISWREIALYLPGRTACQCRDRYNQYLFKEVSNKPWTHEEDEIIGEKYKIYGPKWVKISEFLPDRSGNNIKNRWNSALMRFHGIKYDGSKQERRSKKEKFGMKPVKKIREEKEELSKKEEEERAKWKEEVESSKFKFPSIENLLQTPNLPNSPNLMDLNAKPTTDDSNLICEIRKFV